MENTYIEPLLRPRDELIDPIQFQNTNLAFDTVRILNRDRAAEVVSAFDIDDETLERLAQAPASPFAAEHALIMGIVNVTPDSFSDGGQFAQGDAALNHGLSLIEQGATILDFGAESTRPGADTVPEDEELARLEPIFAGLAKLRAIISVDTRKATVAKRAIEAGAHIINDVSALEFDPDMAKIVANSNASLCLMHAKGNPKTMQDAPSYDNVVLDVYDYLAERIAFAESAGIARERLIIDPGIGFGKTLDQNLALLRHLAVFHGLGCPILLGASRKSMIAKIDKSEPHERLGGSLAIALDAARKGAHILRVHDGQETAQALKLQNRIQIEETQDDA